MGTGRVGQAALLRTRIPVDHKSSNLVVSGASHAVSDNADGSGLRRAGLRSTRLYHQQGHGLGTLRVGRAQAPSSIIQ